MILRYKRLNPLAKPPFRGSEWAAGWDLSCVDFYKDILNEIYVYKTGLAIELPRGQYGALNARSSIYKTTLVLVDGTGIIDADYRGEIIAKFYSRPSEHGERLYRIGDRICQLILPRYEGEIEWLEVDNLSPTKRGSGGFGSTGA